jgi:hypothetical protein
LKFSKTLEQEKKKKKKTQKDTQKRETMEGRNRWGVIQRQRPKVCPLSHGHFLTRFFSFKKKKKKVNKTNTLEAQ